MKGSVRQRSPGTHQIRYEVPADIPGKRKFKSETVKTNSSKVAWKVLRERLTAVENGAYVQKDKETVSQFLDRWLQDYVATNCTPRTQMDYRGYIRCYVASTIGPKPIQSLTARDIQKLYSDMLATLSAKTVLHLHRVLREALHHAVRWGVLVRNVADATTPPHPQAQQLPMWDVPTIHKFLDVAHGSPFRDFYHCAVLTGMRRSEIAGLKWEAVDLEGARLSVTQTRQRITGHGVMVGQPKTAKSRRVIALSPDCVDLLRSVRGAQLLQKATYGPVWQDSGYVFVNAYGQPIEPSEATEDFHNLVKKASLPPLTLHGLRHAHATLLLTAGVHAKVVSERLGHSNVAITLDVYSHVLPHVQEDAANKIDAQLRRAPRSE